MPLQFKRRKQTVVSHSKLQFVFALGLVPQQFKRRKQTGVPHSKLHFVFSLGLVPLQLKQRKQTVVSSAKLQFVFPLGLVPPKYTKKNSMLSNLIDNLFFRMVCFVGFVFGIGRLQTKSQT